MSDPTYRLGMLHRLDSSSAPPSAARGKRSRTGPVDLPVSDDHGKRPKRKRTLKRELALSALALAGGFAAGFGPSTLLMPRPPAAVAQLNAANPFIYKVRAGDSLDIVAAIYGVPVQELMSVNGLLSPTLVVGQELVVPSQRPVVAPRPPAWLVPIVEEQARRYGVDPVLIMLVIQQESVFDPKAVSRSGAMGLMQLMPATADTLGVTDPFDPVQNVAGGTAFLAQLLRQHDGNVRVALAGYNAGPYNDYVLVGQVPPIDETTVYVNTIYHDYVRLRPDGNGLQG
ncbi:MAG: transglycosylase SLT domain-containing protein [Candidatus Eremiobacterota bacterium]